MTMTLFRPRSELALSEVSAVQGFAFSRAVERLGEISLLDMSRPNIKTARVTRYTRSCAPSPGQSSPSILASSSRRASVGWRCA